MPGGQQQTSRISSRGAVAFPPVCMSGWTSHAAQLGNCSAPIQNPSHDTGMLNGQVELAGRPAGWIMARHAWSTPQRAHAASAALCAALASTHRGLQGSSYPAAAPACFDLLVNKPRAPSEPPVVSPTPDPAVMASPAPPGALHLEIKVRLHQRAAGCPPPPRLAAPPPLLGGRRRWRRCTRGGATR